MINTYADIINADTDEILSWIYENYLITIPSSIENVDDLIKINKLLPFLTNARSYFVNATLFLKIETRRLRNIYQTKKTAANKEAYEQMMAKKEVFECVSATLLQQYQALSRMVTVHQEINRELQMNEHIKKG